MQGNLKGLPWTCVFGGADSSVHDRQDRQGRRLGRGSGLAPVPLSKFKAEVMQAPLSSLYCFGWKALGNSRTCHCGGRMCYGKCLSIRVALTAVIRVKFGEGQGLDIAHCRNGGRGHFGRQHIFSQLPAVVRLQSHWVCNRLKSRVARPRRPGPPPPGTDPEPPRGKLLPNNWAIMGPLVFTRMFLSSSFINSFWDPDYQTWSSSTLKVTD